MPQLVNGRSPTENELVLETIQNKTDRQQTDNRQKTDRQQTGNRQATDRQQESNRQTTEKTDN